jgi:hypothetical protein
VHLARTNQVDNDAETVECAKDAREEAVGNALPVRIYVENDDAFLDGDRSGETFALMYILIGESLYHLSCWGRYVWVRLVGDFIWIWMNDRSSTLRVLYILYPDGYFSSNDLEEVDIVKTNIGPTHEATHEPAPW